MLHFFLCRTVNLGQILNGLAGPCADAMPPTISAKWFPDGERITATAFSVTISYFGSAVMDFILGEIRNIEKARVFFSKILKEELFGHLP